MNSKDDDFEEWLKVWKVKYREVALKILSKEFRKKLENLKGEWISQICGLPTPTSKHTELQTRLMGQMISLPKDYGTWWNTQIGKMLIGDTKDMHPSLEEPVERLNFICDMA